MQYILAFILALGISAFLYYRTQPGLSGHRRILLSSLRAIMLFILLLLILSPILHFIRRYTDKPQILYLQDSSRSMNLDHQNTDKTGYLKQMGELVQAKYRANGYEVQTYKFANGLMGEDDNSLLSKSITELNKKTKLSEYHAIILASDGWLKDEELDIIGKVGIPIHSLADSARMNIPDLQIVSVKSPAYAYRNENTVFRVQAKAFNYQGAAVIDLYLGNSLIASRNVQLTPDSISNTEFTHQFRNIGFFKYRLQIRALENEQHLGNNTLPGAIEVLSDKEHIVVISDSPAWDNKFIIDAIATNTRWNSTQYLVRDGRLYQGEEAASLNNDLNPAVIVLINNGNLRLDNASQSYIRNSVQSGTGIFLQGLPPASLKDILPITASNITKPYQGFMNLDDLAREYPMLQELISEASKLPPLDYYYVNAQSGSRILASMNNPQKSPALVLMQKDRYRALGLSFLNLWRWQMQSQDSGYQKMIVNSLIWLSNKALGSYSAIYKNSYLQGEEVQIRLRAEDEIRSTDLDGSPRISIRDSKGNVLEEDFMTREGSEYSYLSQIKDPGDYAFEISESGKKSAGRFSIDALQAEDRDFGFQLPLLQFISAESGGSVIYDAEAFNPVPANESSRVERIDFALYRKWYILSLFILAFCLELFFRRRWGLL